MYQKVELHCTYLHFIDMHKANRLSLQQIIHIMLKYMKCQHHPSCELVPFSTFEPNSYFCSPMDKHTLLIMLYSYDVQELGTCIQEVYVPQNCKKPIQTCMAISEYLNSHTLSFKTDLTSRSKVLIGARITLQV